MSPFPEGPSVNNKFKSLSTMKKFIILAALCTLSLNTLANNTSEPKDAPYGVNRITDNIFVSAGAGVNTILDNGFLGKTGLGVDVQAGKWLIPAGAVRVGWHGLSNQAVDTSNGWFAGEDSFAFNFLHIDWVWDIINTFSYKENRIVSPRLAVEAGGIFTAHNGTSNLEFGFGPGAQLAFHLGKRVEATLEADLILAREEAYRNAGRLIAFPSVSAGIAVKVGKTGFQRNIVTVTETVEVVKYRERDCKHDGQIRDLLAQIDSLKQVKSAQPDKEYVTRPAIIYFDLDKDKLTRREMAHLEFLLGNLPEGARLRITGHADKETGNARHNLDLSRRRSETIAKTLRSWGYPAELIETGYQGDTQNTQYSWDKSEKNRCCYIQVVLD